MRFETTTKIEPSISGAQLGRLSAFGSKADITGRTGPASAGFFLSTRRLNKRSRLINRPRQNDGAKANITGNLEIEKNTIR